MLRVKNSDTAKVLTEAVEQVKIRSATPSTMSNDKSDGRGELFTTYNTDSIAEERVAILSENDVMSLPRGQAFFLTNGGEIHKVRIPMPKNDGQSPPTVEAIMHEVNLCYV